MGLRGDGARYGLIVVAALLAAGCAPKPYVGDARDLHAAMGLRSDAVEASALEASPAALGPEVPYLPLVRPPDVRRVWVTAHLNEQGDMIAGHWVYLMLEPSQWYLRGYTGQRKLELKLPARAPVAPPPPTQGQ